MNSVNTPQVHSIMPYFPLFCICVFFSCFFSSCYSGQDHVVSHMNANMLMKGELCLKHLWSILKYDPCICANKTTGNFSYTLTCPDSSIICSNEIVISSPIVTCTLVNSCWQMCKHCWKSNFSFLRHLDLVSDKSCSCMFPFQILHRQLTEKSNKYKLLE